MKKLLLFALPVCLLTSYIARAEEETQPAEQTEVTAPVVDPKVEEFRVILNNAFGTCKDEMASLEAKFDEAFANSPELVKYIAEKYPGIVATTQDGKKVLAIQFFVGLQVPA